MTYPVYRHLLALKPAARHPEQGDTRLVQPVAMVAWHEGAPVGLVLAETPLTAPVEGESAELLSLYVHPALRGLGMGSALVSRLCELLQQQGLLARDGGLHDRQAGDGGLRAGSREVRLRGRR